MKESVCEQVGAEAIKQNGRSGDRSVGLWSTMVRGAQEPELFFLAKEFCFNPLTVIAILSSLLLTVYYLLS